MALTPEQKNKCAELRKQGLFQRQIAAELGISEEQVRRALRGKDIKATAAKQPTTYKIGGTPQDREVIRLKDEAKRLRTELANTHRSALMDDEVRRILKVLGDTPANPPTWLTSSKLAKDAPEVPVTMWGDWHGGEVVSKAETNGLNEFNMAIMEARVRRLVERTLRLADKHHATYPGIVINLIGDFISGGLHPELQKTDEVESLGAVLAVRDLLVWALGKMVDRFGQVYAPCASGNHGRNTHRPEFKRYVFKNFDWMIYKLLEKYFENDDRIQFSIPSANEVYYKVWNKRFLMTHGDMLGVKGGDGIIGSLGPIARGEFKVRNSEAGRRDYDILLIGHWHQALWLPRVVVANSLKGYDEYAKNALRAPPTTPSQPLFFVHPKYGITSRWEIYLEDPGSAPATDWVSVFERAA